MLMFRCILQSHKYLLIGTKIIKKKHRHKHFIIKHYQNNGNNECD